jgi:RNA polymerase sigma factor (sigma-70 family)
VRDAVQEALVAPPRGGLSKHPDKPRGWLVTVAARRMTDALRSDAARQRRETSVALTALPEAQVAPPADASDEQGADDTLTLLFLCCHPSLSAPSQLALTLRAVGGLTTAEIASAFLVPEATMAQRISRAKATIKAAGGRFTLPPHDQRPERLRAVLHVLYLVFNEGYTATSGPDLARPALTTEAIRVMRDLHRLLPGEGELAGLLALMLLLEARRPARTDAAGDLVPLADQDRSVEPGARRSRRR